MDLGATIREKQEVPSMADPTKKVLISTQK
jgi:hypothetical protein